MLQEIEGLTTAQMNKLKKKKLNTYDQLIRQEPRLYLDARKPIIGYIIKTVPNKVASNGNVYQEYVFEEKDTKRIIKIREFGYTTRPEQYKGRHIPYMVIGKLEEHPVYGASIMSPEVFTSNMDDKRILSIYSKYKGISESTMQAIINDSICYPLKECIPEDILNRNGLPNINEAGRMLHYPENFSEIMLAKRRFLLEDLLYLAIGVQLKAMPQKGKNPLNFNTCNLMTSIAAGLPFTLTQGQKDVVYGIKDKLLQGEHINALVQGDVSCGKSITAFLLMILAIENGYQSVIMAPTVVLAKQHYDGLCDLLKDTDINVAFIHSSLKKKERKEILEGIKNRSIQCIVATHGVTSPDVEFSNLGLVIVDEEQRFGVETREALNMKTNNDIAYISMSATPIPRTMAETIYGENMQVFSIKGMPSGRKPVKTSIWNDDNIPDIVEKQIMEGRQVYIVCPAIEESLSDRRNCKSVKEIKILYENHFRHMPNVRIETLSGKDKGKKMTDKLNDFNAGNINILISTTVVEVGVNNPNATVIVIQNAELFGLSTLHQLRGRVKRGSYEPYCILVSAKEDNERLQALLSTEDGFEIAELDLKNRKSGDILGLKQSGQNKLIEEAEKYPEVYNQIKIMAAELIEKDEYKDFFDYMTFLYNPEIAE